MNICPDVPLSEILWYRIGGDAHYVLEVFNEEDIVEALDFIVKNNIQKVLIAGIGSNLLVTDKYFDGAVIRLMRSAANPQIKLTDDGFVEVFAGELLDDVIHFSFDHNLIGLEWAGGLPGTVGGAVRGNAGAFGFDMSKSFFGCSVIDRTDPAFGVQTLALENMAFGYRTSVVKQKQNLIIISVKFKLQAASDEELSIAKKTYKENCEYRCVNHPIEYPSCGSTFNNIKEKEQVEKVLSVFPDLKEKVDTTWHGKVATGSIITKLGLTGRKIGNAQISEKHANFIVNLGGATFADVYQLIETVRQKFTATFGFAPETEVEIVQ